MTEPPLSQGLYPALNSYGGHKSFSKPNEKPQPAGQYYRGTHAEMEYLVGEGGGVLTYTRVMTELYHSHCIFPFFCD